MYLRVRGWFEVFLSGGEETPEKREFARRMDALLQSLGKMNSFPLRAITNYRSRKAKPFQSILAPGIAPERGKGRTISVGKSIETGGTVCLQRQSKSLSKEGGWRKHCSSALFLSNTR
jgi:hypothetical protein